MGSSGSEGTVFDKGPWQVGEGGAYLVSDDFKHDVGLRVSGDFATPAERQAYGAYLAGVLSRGCVLEQATHDLADEGGLLAALVAAGKGPNGALLVKAAEEIARLRSELADADRRLEALQASQYARAKVQEAQEPSEFAQALQTALRRS